MSWEKSDDFGAYLKRFPKVPRWDHPAVEGMVDLPEQCVVTEKLDGGNFRWVLYEDRFEWPADVEATDPDDGELVFGTRRKIIGTESDKVNSDYRGVVRTLVDAVEKDIVRGLQDEIGRLVWFGEVMIPHSLRYWDHGDPPELVAFDVYNPSWDSGEPKTIDPEHPYQQTFEPFMGYGDARDYWETAVNLGDGIHFVKKIWEGELDTLDIKGNFEIPKSAVADVTAEGIVIRIGNQAVKYRREDFVELNKKTFMSTENLCVECRTKDRSNAEKYLGEAADVGAEYIVHYICTDTRIRKQVKKLIREEGGEFGMHLMSDLTNRVWHDMWVEESLEIAEIDIIFNPNEMMEHLIDVCKVQLKKMEQEAKKRDQDPTEYWS